MSSTMDPHQPANLISKQAARILVVDDVPGVKRVVGLALTRAGHDVRTASSSAQAIAACESESFDLVLSDLTVLEGNGHELARWMAANRPETRTAIMTAHDVEVSDYSRRYNLLPKPFLPKDLVSFVARVLSDETAR
jgi:DNA-binding NtrC family response regulator